ncbi:MAG: chromosome segregation protein SMC [Oscillospiraceae bacterium]|nr:chromosome segregation protein SMC [Oscillospiraceae bacterium]
MYLKSLEMHGFKSFPDKIKLDFDKGITAVVGPNGSGKSNIGDAVRWVLGEQSSKTLRGGKMEDVIFAGTQLRKPMGFASVTLVISNEDRMLNIDADEAAVTRKLYRSGESEYIINGSAARLKDITELFMDTGLGRDGYSIIGQGKVAEIVSAKSGERREIFEEAAGISKLRYKKGEAVRRLDDAQDNILRLNDIISELESRVEPLKRQSEKAEKFLKLSEQKKSYEITVWMNELKASREKLSELSDKILIAAAEYNNTQADIERLEEESRLLYKEAAAGNIRIEHLRNEILETERSNTDLHSAIAVFKNDISHCEETIAELEKRIENTGLSKEENHRLAAEKISLIEKNKSECTRTDEEYAKTERELNAVSGKAEGADRSLSEKSAALNKLYIKQSEYNLTIAASDRNISDIMSQKKAAEERLAAALGSQTQLESEMAQVRDGLSLVEEKRTEQENKIAGLNRLLESKKQKYTQKSTDNQQLALSLRDKEQRIKLLSDLENSMEGFAHAVKTVVKAGRQGRISGIIGTVAQLISVPPQYGTAIETALGGALQNIVTENEDSAKRGIRLLKEANAGRATFLPLTSVKGNRLNEKGLADCMGYIALACEIVEYDPKLEGVVTSLMGRTVVAEDIDCAAAIAKKYGYRFRIVTLDGQIVNAGGSFTGGSANRSAGVLTRKNEIDTLTAEAEKERAALEKENNSLIFLKAEVDKLTLEKDAAEEELRLTEQDKIRFDAEEKRISQLMAQNEDVRKSHDDTIAALDRREAELADAVKKAENGLAELSKTISSEEKLINGENEQKDALKQQRETLSARLSEIKLMRAGLDKDCEALKAALEALEAQYQTIGDDTARAAEAIEEQKRIIGEKNELITLKEKQLNSAADRSSEINEKILSAQQDILKSEQRSNEIRSSIKALNADKEKFGGEKTRLEERHKSIQTSCDEIIRDMEEQYELYPSEAQAFVIENADKLQIAAALQQLKQKIRALGTVNVAAIEEYKEVSQRYAFMSGQLADVEKSKRELEKLIDDLTKSMKIRFTESFNQINENFKEIFVELFGGGRAELSLSYPENVLESGIDIFVAPPGKVIKNLSLLSGGEQAFVAIAIYFSILRIKPAPFCILDEIEAALDDVNVTKYARYMRNFTDTTQFIAITHRRGTMDEADVMYGVTMQEKGISKLLKLQQNQFNDLAEDM